MSLVFLGRMWKLGLRNSSDAIMQAERVRFLSSLVESSPYLLNRTYAVRGGSSMNLYDPRKEQTVVADQGMMTYQLSYIGASRGWVGFMNSNDPSVYLTNMLNHKVISLPPLSPDCTYNAIINMSLSSFPSDDSCVVAIKFYGGRMCFCRPGDSAWTKTESSSKVLDCSSVLYSNRDSNYYQRFDRLKLPDLLWSEFELLESCFYTEHLVESPTGEVFDIMWFLQLSHGGKAIHWKECNKKYKNKEVVRKTKRFMVYREDEDCYTYDIGDLCIFLGQQHNEAFCLQSSQFTGLKPNSIYFAALGHSGVYNLATDAIHDLPFTNPFLMWLAPLSH
ncbi:uncharacterized protein LOC111829913 [Capsella rubella]|uniref:uncharacterized protein LOC111829913 n=1 Tax=Capsella rubella TaxID=81985 RepID=UPI000CD4C6C5|nr:uncharacterized protein LOC111829913 [Capsella rubella]